MGKLNIRPYSFHDGKEFLPASIFFALHATLSLYAIHGMNIPMYGAIKRCTPLVSLILSVLVISITMNSSKKENEGMNENVLFTLVNSLQ